MTELPESVVISRQLSETICGKVISSAVADYTPHKLVWYFGEPKQYGAQLKNKTIGKAAAQGGNIELCVQDMRILFQDGAVPHFLEKGQAPPKKHQLLLTFSDGTGLSVTVRMFGGICVYRDGENDNKYYLVAKEKNSPLSSAFDKSYFMHLCTCSKFEKLSAKAFLATEQRIPGLGNGVLQDILWHIGIHPKRKMGALSEAQLEQLFQSIKTTLSEMAAQGGRDTEQDFFGKYGGYRTILSKNTVGKPCPVCGTAILRESYLGGNVYFCPLCQPL